MNKLSRITFLFALSIVSLNTFSQNVNFDWVKQIGGTGWDPALKISLGPDGDIYSCGAFEATSDFDPGVGVFNMTSQASRDGYIMKLNSLGDFEWAIQLTGPSEVRVSGMDVDPSGDIYCTGIFYSTTDFDPGAGVFNMTAVGNGDFFVAKYNSSGDFLWAKHMPQTSGGNFNQWGNSITIDIDGSTLVTGYFDGTVDFDPGVGVYSMTGQGGFDIFILKLNSSGNFEWARQFGGTAADQGNSIKTDSKGNVYSTGSFSETVDFDPGVGTHDLTAFAASDIFILKLDSSGIFKWVHSFGDAWGDMGNAIDVDKNDNVYATGVFPGGTIDFDPGPGVTNLGFGGAFIVKFDSLGVLGWAKGFSGSAHPLGIVVDSIGSVYSCGRYSGTTDMDPGASVENLNTYGSWDAYLSKLDSSGNYVWAKHMGGSAADYAYDLSIDSEGSVYTGGI